MLFFVGLIFSDFLDLLFYYFIFFWFFRLILFHYSLFHGLEPKPGQKMIMKSPLQNHIPLRCGFAFSCGSKKFLMHHVRHHVWHHVRYQVFVHWLSFPEKQFPSWKAIDYFSLIFSSRIFRNIPLYTKTKIIQDNIQKNIYNYEKIIFMWYNIYKSQAKGSCSG